MRKMEFEIPDELAANIESQIPVTERSPLVVKLLQVAIRPQLTDEEWDAAAMSANADLQLNVDIDDWQAFSDPMKEPWDAPSPR